jgi:hypothetical protein
MSPLLTRPASISLTAAFAVLLPLAACRNVSEPTALTATSARLAIVDGAHWGNPKFVWLPPTVPTTPTYSGTFASGLSPTVTVCDETTTPCGIVARFTKASGTGGAKLVENTASPSYRVTWLSSKCETPAYCPLTPGSIYRMSVTVPSGTSSEQLGYADIKIYGSLVNQLQDPDRSKYVPLLPGRPLGIAFRIAR